MVGRVYLFLFAIYYLFINKRKLEMDFFVVVVVVVAINSFVTHFQFKFW